MEISIDTRSVMNNIGAKFLMETGSKDPLPPEGMMMQAINEANARLRTVFGRFLEATYVEAAEDSLAVGQVITYSLIMSSRRQSGKAQDMADLTHSYLTDSALANLYVSMSMSERATMHEQMSAATATEIEKKLRSKIPPIQ